VRFFVAVTASFQLLYLFLVLGIGTRRILHWNVTAHPTAEWTAQQFRSVLTGDEPYRFVVHDRDAVFSAAVDDALRSMRLCVRKTPARVLQANAFCERLIGTARRDCLDQVIPLNERHFAEDPRSVGTSVQSGSPARESRARNSRAVIADRPAGR